jgi:hypothetical protein
MTSPQISTFRGFIMGLYFEGEPITEHAMLVNILGIDLEDIVKLFDERPYTCKHQ